MNRTFNPALYFYWVLLVNVPLHAQLVNDPLVNTYKLGESSEFYISYTDAAKTHTNHNVIAIDSALNSFTQQNAGQSEYIDKRRFASATGDFDADGRDDIVNVRDSSGGILITIPLINKNLTVSGQTEYYDTTHKYADYKRLRVCTGNFDNDIQDEIAVCYGPDSEKHLVISLFEIDASMNIRLLGSNNLIAYLDPNFDIASGDFDANWKDELAVVRNDALPYQKDPDVLPPIYTSTYDLYFLEYDTTSKKLELTYMKQNINFDNQDPSLSDPGDDIQVNEMRIACGDINADLKDEVVVGWSFVHNYEELPMHYIYLVFLNRFWFSESGNLMSSENSIVSWDDFVPVPFHPWPDDRRVALTLKCEQLDNTGGDEILINSAQTVYIYDEIGEERELVELGHAGGKLNVKGNECFALSDLNPDTLNQDFRKEIITLKANTTHFNQIFTLLPSTTNMLVYSIDNIVNNSITFHEPITPLLFDDTENISVSAFVAGDFDMKCARIFYIGAPDVVESEIQQPIVILNSPPVHFDILGGKVHDLNNAYNRNGNPPFYASYYNGKGSENTTSVDVGEYYGFSEELTKYDIAAGNGYEDAVSSAMENGGSYFRAFEQNAEMQESRNVYTEDYVLYTSLLYKYYKYPVYNAELIKVGYIGVLSPQSKVTSNWTSGNSWEHPAYSPDHETGNILSYKSYMNEDDFYSGMSDFVSSEFSQVPISNTSDGDFGFTGEDIFSTGENYAYKAVVGMSELTKKGFEGSVKADIGLKSDFFSFGESVSTDIKTGTTNDISTFFSKSSLFTHNTMLKNTFKLEGILGNLDLDYDNSARYYVTPYIYRSQCGAIVLDYKVRLDPDNMSWWEDNYKDSCDLAFILPWKYATQQGDPYIKPSKKQKTNEIHFYPPIISPGDTVCITTRVHNYSLMPFKDILKVDYYLGDPQDGVKLKDIYGTTGTSLKTHMDYQSNVDSTDFEEILTFIWKVPNTVTCSPRIYAVIDPQNEVKEIHKNNNVGWNKLYIYGCDECEYEEPVAVNDILYVSPVFKAFPNPFNSYTSIHFSLPCPESVRLEICDLAGKRIDILADKLFPLGDHVVQFDAGKLRAGVYICKISAGNYNKSLKLVLIK
jgi:hypothetical protein